MIFVESYFERSLKQIVFDKLKQTTNLSGEKPTIGKAESERPCFQQAAGVVVFDINNQESLILQNAKTSVKYVV